MGIVEPRVNKLSFKSMRKSPEKNLFLTSEARNDNS